MLFSTKAEYGLRAIIKIAQAEKEKPLSLSQISKEEGISLAYLEKIVGTLKKAGLVKSIRGASGGYSLAKPVDKISVKDIVSALEGSLSPTRCSLLKFSCGHKNCCAKKVWHVLEENIEKTLEGLKLKDVI